MQFEVIEVIQRRLIGQKLGIFGLNYFFKRQFLPLFIHLCFYVKSKFSKCWYKKSLTRKKYIWYVYNQGNICKWKQILKTACISLILLQNSRWNTCLAVPNFQRLFGMFWKTPRVPKCVQPCLICSKRVPRPQLWFCIFPKADFSNIWSRIWTGSFKLTLFGNFGWLPATFW